MMLVLNDIDNEYKEHDHDNGYVGSLMHHINPRKFKRNEEEIRYIGWVFEHLPLTSLFRIGRLEYQGKLHFVSNFNVSSSFVSNFNVFSYVSLICCRCLVDKLWW